MGSASRDANAFDWCQLAAAQDGSSDGRRALPIARNQASGLMLGTRSEWTMSASAAESAGIHTPRCATTPAGTGTGAFAPVVWDAIRRITSQATGALVAIGVGAEGQA
jgi:hypothetical protein